MGQHKYIYIHGYGSQLLDPRADPDAWHTPAGHLGLRQVKQKLNSLLMAQFDPARIAADGGQRAQAR